MSEDIKEILLFLEFTKNEDIKRQWLFKDEAILLLDYITNLQQKYDTAIFVGKELNKSLEDYKSRNEKTINKIELLIKDLKDMQKLEKETGKEHFTLELFAIRIKEIYRLLQGSDK